MERREDEEGKQPSLPDLPIKGPVKIAKCAQAQNESRGALVLPKERTLVASPADSGGIMGDISGCD
jgi:hypothetical protein